MFQPLGAVFGLIKYGIVQGTSVVATYGIPETCSFVNYCIT